MIDEKDIRERQELYIFDQKRSTFEHEKTHQLGKKQFFNKTRYFYEISVI